MPLANIFGEIYFANPTSGISHASILCNAKTDQSQSLLIEWFKTFYWLNTTKAGKMSNHQLKVQKLKAVRILSS